jgi:hypothetical protein
VIPPSLPEGCDFPSGCVSFARRMACCRVLICGPVVPYRRCRPVEMDTSAGALPCPAFVAVIPIFDTFFSSPGFLIRRDPDAALFLSSLSKGATVDLIVEGVVTSGLAGRITTVRRGLEVSWPCQRWNNFVPATRARICGRHPCRVVKAMRKLG